MTDERKSKTQVIGVIVTLVIYAVLFNLLGFNEPERPSSFWTLMIAVMLTSGALGSFTTVIFDPLAQLNYRRSLAITDMIGTGLLVIMVIAFFSVSFFIVFLALPLLFIGAHISVRITHAILSRCAPDNHSI